MSGFGELANAIQIFTGAVNTIHSVYKAYEAIKDVNQQIAHLTSICRLVEENLKITLELLMQRQEAPNQDERRMEYYSTISQVVKTVEKDLDDVKRRIPSSENLPKIKMFEKVFRSKAYKATDMALTMNVAALKRIETVALHLQWTTTNLWAHDRANPRAVDQHYINELRNLSQQFITRASTMSSDSGPMTPSVYSPDPEFKTRSQEYVKNIQQFDSSAFEIANSVIVKTLASGTQTPIESRPISPLANTPIPMRFSLPLTETHVSRKELELRLAEARKMADLASEQEFPDAAAAYHAQAIKFYDELCEGRRPNVSESTKLESHHISILITCLQVTRRMEGIERLNQLALDTERLAGTDELEPADLHRLRRDVGDLYFKLHSWDHAVQFFRLAIFEPGFLERYPDNEAEVKSIAVGIIEAYKAGGDHIKITPFRQTLEERLGSDPISEPREYSEAFDWCRKWKFKVNRMSAQPCFTEEKDTDGDFPLHKAVCDPNASVEVLRQLASDRNAVNAKGKRDLTPLLMAVQHGRLDAVRVLLEEGASLDIRTPERDMSETVLHVCRDKDIMKLLLDKLQSRRASVAPSLLPQEDENMEEPQRIDIDSQNPYIGTALHNSCDKDDWPMVELLLEYNADPNAENYLHETPLIIACYNKGNRVTTRRIVRGLVNNGANVDHVDDDGKCARKGLRRKGLESEIKDLLQPRGVRSDSSSLRRGGETDSMASQRHFSIGSRGLFSEGSRDGSFL